MMDNTGTGPGPITRDGSPVEFYRHLGARAEPDIIAQVTPPGGTVLELGAGVGRVTHPLVERGFRVVAVDESPEMLAYVRGAETVLARVEGLRLERRFDTVVMASQLVNTVDDAVRRALLDTCARHVAPGGSVLLQWMPAEAHDRWHVGQGRAEGDVTITMAAVEEVSPGVFEATMRYTYESEGEGGTRVWSQSFSSRRLTDDALAADLAAAGLRLDLFLTEDRTWVAARPFTR
ncbi:class I SAM-dependent methyltransferase [Actinomadura sp. ATCC 31491]|uniref:Class I SAM-dependent methyltransferase n=1 Tax=Actinomadura luzonensis TaxID=2805427 RepID=A0ABT0G3R2_9ACTN|nr:class I SAM-dependent methyltransferase [Actinomadura luzonensis]MCK2219237.1 class I SAM-dependent methyltransferase [Actinomadura luzonensis]